MDKGVRARCRASCALAASAWSHASCGTTTGDGGRSNLSTVVEWLTETGSSPGCILTKAEVCHCARVFASSSSGLESDMTAMRPNSSSSHEQHPVSDELCCAPMRSWSQCHCQSDQCHWPVASGTGLTVSGQSSPTFFEVDFSWSLGVLYTGTEIAQLSAKHRAAAAAVQLPLLTCLKHAWCTSRCCTSTLVPRRCHFLGTACLPTTNQSLTAGTAQIGITNGNTVDGRDHAGATATSFRSGITTVTGQSLGGECAGHNCHMR